MKNFEEILRDPSAAFAEPAEVLGENRWSGDEKVRILRQWRYDIVQLQVASGENMPGDKDQANGIRQIDECLRRLGAAAESD